LAAEFPEELEAMNTNCRCHPEWTWAGSPFMEMKVPVILSEAKDPHLFVSKKSNADPSLHSG